MSLKKSSLLMIALLGISALLMLCAALNLSGEKARFFGLALTVLDLVYFVVLVENMRSGRGIQTRGGLVQSSNAPVAYFFVYLLLIFVGIIALIVFLSALVFAAAA